MSICDDAISRVETEIQKALYETASLQSDMSKVNIEERSKLNTLLRKKLKLYEAQKAKYQKLQVALTVLRIVTIVLSVALMFMPGIDFLVAAAAVGVKALGPFLMATVPTVATLVEAGATASVGIMQIAGGSYYEEMASTKKDTNSSTALSQYVSDKGDDNNSKMKDTYSILSNLMKTFNQIIGLYGEALQKVT